MKTDISIAKYSKSYTFPNEFDFNIYKIDAINYMKTISPKATDNEIINHYENYGKYNGSICSKIKTKLDFVNLVNLNNITNGLEIGPCCRPHLKNIPSITYAKYLDYFSNEELFNIHNKTKWVMDEGLQHIDYVIKNNIKYTDVISEKFDLIYSSHSIEHAPCLISMLQNWSDVLNDNGLVFLGIPDYYFIFDRYKNPSTIFDVLNIYYKNTTIPASLQILENQYLNADNNTHLHWSNEFNNEFSRLKYLKDYEDNINSKSTNIINNISNIKNILLNNKNYIDTHCWKFSPCNFKHIMDILYKTKLIDLKLIRCYNTIRYHNEFFAIIQKIPHE